MLLLLRITAEERRNSQAELALKLILIRLGGLLHRIKHCRERLQAFYDGDIRKIEELEQEQLDFFGFEKPCARPKFNSWSLNVSTNVVSCGLDVE